MKAALLAVLEDSDLRTQVRALLGVEERDREIAVLKDTNKAQQRLIEEQEERLSELEQYSRKNCLNFTGLPETEGENPMQLVADIAKTIGVKLEKWDIDNAHRIGRPRDNSAAAASATGPGSRAAAQPPAPRPLIVKFTTFAKRDMVWWKRKDLRTSKPPRGCSLPEDSLKNVFIQENLTARNRSILFEARKLKREGKLHSAWSDSCVLKVRKVGDGPTVRIKKMEDLERFRV